MTKHPTSIRISDMTRQQLADLARQTGLGQTEVISTAVDRMYQQRAGAEKSGDVLLPESFREQFEKVQDLEAYDLDSLEMAIHFRRLELMAARLTRYGFTCRVDDASRGFSFRYVLVKLTDSELSGQWATLDECQRLLDTVRNLPAGKAFERWSVKVAPLTDAPYSRGQAIADVRTERASLRQQLDNGDIDKEDFRLGWMAARDYLDMAE